jgi:hypothetical protein
LTVDSNGMLNVASVATGGGWRGPDPVGNAGLVPGSPITVFRQSRSVFTALMVDRDGVLNTASLDLTGRGTWRGPNPVGSSSLVPGSPVTVFQQAEMAFTALVVDRDGILNALYLDVGGSWQGPETIGTASLLPGSPVAVVHLSRTVFAALVVDRQGILNAATLKLSKSPSWQGPDGIGTASLSPGSPVAILAR